MQENLDRPLGIFPSARLWNSHLDSFIEAGTTLWRFYYPSAWI
jgi:hypothetical protein